MRALFLAGVAIVCAYGCGGDDGPAASSDASAGEGGAESTAGDGTGATPGNGAVAGQASDGGVAGGGGVPNLGGMTGEAGVAGGGAQIATIGIVEGETHFLDYGKLRIVFDEPVDASTLSITLQPQLPARLVATEVAAVSATTVDVTLGYYHLPRDYVVKVTGALSDSSPFQASSTLSGLGNDSTRLTNEKPRTGTEISGATSWSCGDWLTTGFYSISGDSRYVDRNWTFKWTTDCDGEEASLYCFEN